MPRHPRRHHALSSDLSEAFPTPIYPDLRGRHVLITGGSNGIGAALCQAFARQGAILTMLDRDVERGEEVMAACRDLTEDATLFPVDLTVLPALATTLQEIVRSRPVVDVLIVNAGYDPRHDGLNMTDAAWHDLFQLNVAHYFVTCRELLPSMQAAGREPSIIMTASHTVWLAKPDLVAYNSTKAAIVGLTRSLAEAAGPHGVRVNAVAPGWTMTERQLAQWVTPEAKAQTIHHEQALPLEITPEALAGTYLFLASRSSRPLTRQVLVADAGQSKH